MIFVLFLIVIGIFFFFEEFETEKSPGRFLDIFKSEETPVKPAKKPPLIGKMPKVSIIMDDLGVSKKKALKVFDIKSPLTISILPQEKYSRWIAEEAHKLGRDIIAHVPMEATRPFKLGKGGLYTWMSDKEIIETIKEDISSIPYIKGVSNHMGSAFTQDKKSMRPVISEIKKHGLFFLDSLTTSKSSAYQAAKAQGIKTVKRDVFLDNADDPVEIQKQWERLVKIAKKEGRAIALAHPRKNTLDFLNSTLENNGEVRIVPVSELIN